MEHEKMPLPDLNCLPPDDHLQHSSSSSPQLQLQEVSHQQSPAAAPASRKRKMGERESESSSHWIKAFWNKFMNFISNPNNPNKKKKRDVQAEEQG